MMDKISLLLLCMALTVLTFGQHPSMGLQLGLNISSLGSNDNYDMKSKAGMHGGLFLHVPLQYQWMLQTEIYYSKQGANYKTTNGVDHSLFLNYVNIPLQVQYLFGKCFRIQTGPQLAFLVSTKDKVMGEETGFFTSQDFKTIDWLWSVGVHYIGHSKWGIFGRYNFSMGAISNGGVNIFQNKVFQLGISYIPNRSRKTISK